MLRRKYERDKNKVNWENYRKYRNYAEKLVFENILRNVLSMLVVQSSGKQLIL